MGSLQTWHWIIFFVVAALVYYFADLGRKVHIADRDVTVDGMYLRIIIHANEHMGQLIAYARMTGIVPPWSKD